MKNICRLTNRRQFAAVKGGYLIKSPLFSLEVFNHNNPKMSPRIGFTVTKRQGCAVQRNRIRRRLKEMVRLYADGILKSGHDYVVVAKRGILFSPFADLCTHFIELVKCDKQRHHSAKVFSRKK